MNTCQWCLWANIWIEGAKCTCKSPCEDVCCPAREPADTYLRSHP